MLYIVIMLEDERGFKTNEICFSGRQPFITDNEKQAFEFRFALEEQFPGARYRVAETKLIPDLI